jgi:hypothetical protein
VSRHGNSISSKSNAFDPDDHAHSEIFQGFFVAMDVAGVPEKSASSPALKTPGVRRDRAASLKPPPKIP